MVKIEQLFFAWKIIFWYLESKSKERKN